MNSTHIDFVALRSRAQVGINRAAGFLGLITRFAEQETPTDLSIKGPIELRVLPNPLSLDTLEEMAYQFRIWVASKILADLDQVLNQLLDESWRISNYFITDGPYLSLEERTKPFPKHQSNAAQNHKRVMELLGCFDARSQRENSCIETLASARNCISHSLGYIDQLRAPNGKLTLEWLGVRGQLRQGKHIFKFDEISFPFRGPEDNMEMQVEFRFEKIAKSFGLGEQLVISPYEMAEIIWFYNHLFDRINADIVEFAKSSDIFRSSYASLVLK
jgi:hypothetical protein